MGKVSTIYDLCVDHAPGPSFTREGPFCYSDLPPELREKILRLLLVRGNVAMGKQGAIKNRFSHWSHERPMWQLLMVSRQLRAEASAVLYALRHNTFYFPIDGNMLLPSFYLRPWNSTMFETGPPRIEKIDCAFDMGDFKDTTFNVYEDAKSAYDARVTVPGGLSF